MFPNPEDLTTQEIVENYQNWCHTNDIDKDRKREMKLYWLRILFNRVKQTLAELEKENKEKNGKWLVTKIYL